MDDVIMLISQEYTPNSFGAQIPTEGSRTVWATIQSVSRQEVADAGQRGLSPEAVAITPAINYCGESIAEWGGKRYGIYRTYHPPDSDDIELYLERKAGVWDGKENTTAGA